MALTTYLREDENTIKLFDTIPSLEYLCVSFGHDSECFSRYAKPKYSRIKGANPSLVGTAYDFYLRAYIQKVNSKLIEETLPDILIGGLYLIEEDDVLSTTKYERFYDKILERWDRRIRYIKGEDIPERVILNDSLYFAYVEQYARSKQQVENYFSTSLYDLNDLIKLSYATRENERFFKTKKQLYMNPTFGFGSELVNGADGDFIIGNTLFDIKTSNYLKYNHDYIKQIIGYYLLSKFGKYEPTKITQLALYYPRFEKIILFKIDDILKIYNLHKMGDYFFKHLLGMDNKIQKTSFEVLRKELNRVT